MIAEFQQVLRVVLPSAAKTRLKSVLDRLHWNSLRLAMREQGLWELQERLAEIVPDLRHQYSSVEVDSAYLLLKVRGMHAFQVALTNAAIASVRATRVCALSG